MHFITPYGPALLDDRDEYLLYGPRGPRKVLVAYQRGRIREVRVSGLSLHRLVMPPYGPHLEGVEAPHVDHVNRNPLDNRRENLRHVTRTQNMQNRPGWSKVGYKGVVWHETRPGKGRSKYEARIVIEGKKTYLGTGTAMECARMYDLAAVEHFGEYAVLNFPDLELAA